MVLKDKDKLKKEISETEKVLSTDEILENSNEIQRNASMKRMDAVRAGRKRNMPKQVQETQSGSNSPGSVQSENSPTSATTANSSGFDNQKSTASPHQDKADEPTSANSSTPANNSTRKEGSSDSINENEKSTPNDEKTPNRNESSSNIDTSNVATESKSGPDAQKGFDENSSRNTLDEMKKGTSGKPSPGGDSPKADGQSKLDSMGDSLKSKLKGSSESDTESSSTISDTSTKAAKAAMDAQKVAKATSSTFSTIASVVMNPITWIGLALFIVALSLIAGSQILGKSDFAKNCSPNGDIQVGADMPKEEMDRANVVATWLTSNNWEFNGGKPMTVVQAAGVVGNWSQEGRILPTAFQGQTSNPDYYKTCDNKCVLDLGTVGGLATGFMQWDSGRRVNLAKHAEKLNKQWYDANVQLDFMRLEADGAEKASYLRNFAKCTDATTCAVAFSNDVERAGQPEMQNRVAFAEKFIKQFKPTSGGAIGDASFSGNVDSCSSDGSNGMDTSGLIALALSIAYPASEYNKGVIGSHGDKYGGAHAHPAYKEAKKLAQTNGGADPMPGLFASCDRFVATVLKATKADVDFPWGATAGQYSYMQNSPKWQPVKCGDRKPGDVIITRGDGHVMLYVGNIKGQDSVASASYLERVGTVNGGVSCSGDDWNADGRLSMAGFRLK